MDAAIARDFTRDRWQDLATAVDEAAMNAVVHAGGGQAIVRASDDTMQVWITDTGAGIAVQSLHRATLERGYTTAGSLGQASGSCSNPPTASGSSRAPPAPPW